MVPSLYNRPSVLQPPTHPPTHPTSIKFPETTTTKGFSALKKKKKHDTHHSQASSLSTTGFPITNPFFITNCCVSVFRRFRRCLLNTTAAAARSRAAARIAPTTPPAMAPVWDLGGDGACGFGLVRERARLRGDRERGRGGGTY